MGFRQSKARQAHSTPTGKATKLKKSFRNSKAKHDGFKQPILTVRHWFGINEKPKELFGNQYANDRFDEKRSQIRLRGQLWYQLVVFGLYVFAGLIFALLTGTFIRLIWYLIYSGAWGTIAGLFGKVVTPAFSLDYVFKYFDYSINGGAFQDTSWVVWTMMVVVLTVTVYKGSRNWYDWVQKFGNRTINRNRFTSLKELVKTYELVPDRNVFYDVNAGMPVSHISGYSFAFFMLFPFLAIKQWIKGILGINREQWGPAYQQFYNWLLSKPMFEKHWKRQLTVQGGYAGYYFIDDTPTHEVVIGATRAGKDQLLGYVLIDLLRRGKNPPNVIDTDAKNEDGKMSFMPLKRAGFDVQLLNIADTDWSETWNPFQVALDYALDGELDKARDEAMVVVQIIGASKTSNSENGVWDATAADTQLSIILILIWLAIEYNDETLATPASVPQFINSVNKFSDPKDKNKDGLTKYFDMLRKLDPIPPIVNEAILKAGSYLGSQGDTKASIMFTLQSRISLFASETVARLTSRSTIKMADYGFPRMFKATLPAEYAGLTAKVELYDLTSKKGQQSLSKGKYLEQDSVKVSRSGVLSYPFHNIFPDDWLIKVHFEDSGNPVHLRPGYFTITGEKRVQRNFDHSVKVDPDSLLPVTKMVIQKTAFNLFDGGEATFNLRYSEKPTAMFLVTPQNNDNYASLASLFLGQVFSINTQIASEVTRRKMDRRIVYKLNEFSMFPRIPGFDNFLTRGLTYGHIVVMYVQDEAQIGKHYESEEVSEIKNNMMTTVLIQTKDVETNKAMSERLGDIEVQKELVNSQIGMQQQDKGNRQISIDKVPLMSPKELEEMNDREMVILRQAKRLDKHGRPVRPLPIFNSGTTWMPNTRDLIGLDYSLNYYTTDLHIKNNTKHLSYEDMFQDFTPYFEALADRVGESVSAPNTDSALSQLNGMDMADMMQAFANQQSEGGNTSDLTESEVAEQQRFLDWQNHFDQVQDEAFITSYEFGMPGVVAAVEQLIGGLLTKKYYMYRSAEQTNALQLAKQGKLFKFMPEINNNRVLFKLLDNSYVQMYELQKRINHFRDTGELDLDGLNESNETKNEDDSLADEQDETEKITDGDTDVSSNSEES